jgi:glycosyltransferase involved in cell wall biosynthesis
VRILFLHPHAWTGEYPILQELTRQGHEICVLEERRGLGAARRLADHFQSNDDRIRTLWFDPSRGMEKLLTFPVDRWFKRDFEGRNLAHRMWMIRGAMAHFQPQAVICSEGFAYGIPAAMLKRLGLLPTPLLTSYIGGDILDCPEAEVGKRRVGATPWLIRQGLATPDILRPVSPFVRAILLAEGANPDRIRVIPSHLVASEAHLEPFRHARARYRGAICARYQLNPEKPVVVTLGGNQKGKGLQVLLDAWPRIKEGCPGVQWLLCGPRNPWFEREIEPRLRQFASGIVVTGALKGDDVFAHLAAADVHVNPSLCESLNMVTVEAAAVGTPTIGSDGAGISHWISHHGAGQVTRRSNAGELADAIIHALASPQIRESWARGCRDLVPEFSIDHIAQKLVETLVSASPSLG